MNKFLGLLVATVLLASTQAYGALGFYGSSGESLGKASSFQCGTGLTCSKVGSRVRFSSSPTLASTLAITGTEGVNGVLTLSADDSDDSGDDWQLNSVASGNAFTIGNDASGSQVAKVSIAASTGNVTLVGGLIGDGGDSLVGFLRPVTAASAATITAAQCGGVFVSAGAIEMELPEASTAIGCRLTFVVGAVANFTIDPDAADIILLLTNAAGDSLIADALGESITLVAISATQWAVEGAEKGTWTDSN